MKTASEMKDLNVSDDTIMDLFVEFEVTTYQSEMSSNGGEFTVYRSNTSSYYAIKSDLQKSLRGKGYEESMARCIAYRMQALAYHHHAGMESVISKFEELGFKVSYRQVAIDRCGDKYFKLEIMT